MNMARRQNQTLKEKRRGRKREKMATNRDGLDQKTKRPASQYKLCYMGIRV